MSEHQGREVSTDGLCRPLLRADPPQLCMEETRQAIPDMPPSPLAPSPELLQ